MFDWLKRGLGLEPTPTEISETSAPHPVVAQAVQETRKDVEAVIPLLREDVVIDKRKVEGDRVRVSIETLTETKTVEEELLSDAVDVRRVSFDRPLSEIPEIRREGDVTIVPVVRERLVLKKELVLVEEVHITHRREQQTVQREIDIRRQEPRIERLPKDAADTFQVVEKTV